MISLIPTKDTIYNMNSGFYSSRLKVHDVYNKTLKDYDFSYLENFENDIHTEGTEPSCLNQQMQYRKNLSEYPDTKLYVSTTSDGKHFYESKDYPYQSDNLINTMQRRLSRFFQIDKGIKCQVKVPGQTTKYSRRCYYTKCWCYIFSDKRFTRQTSIW